jgi:hypothetical protein
MLSRVRIVPKAPSESSYQATVTGDVYDAGQAAAFFSTTSRGKDTTITGTIKPSQQQHAFLIRHNRPLQVSVRGAGMLGQVRLVSGGDPKVDPPDADREMPSTGTEPIVEPGEGPGPKKKGRIGAGPLAGVPDKVIGGSIAAIGAAMLIYSTYEVAEE